jgi:hypothetical protein
MIKYISIKNFDTVENRVLSHPEEPYITGRFMYYLEPVGACAKLMREALRNDRGHKKGEKELVAYYNKGDLE